MKFAVICVISLNLGRKFIIIYQGASTTKHSAYTILYLWYMFKICVFRLVKANILILPVPLKSITMKFWPAYLKMIYMLSINIQSSNSCQSSRSTHRWQVAVQYLNHAERYFRHALTHRIISCNWWFFFSASKMDCAKISEIVTCPHHFITIR